MSRDDEERRRSATIGSTIPAPITTRPADARPPSCTSCPEPRWSRRFQASRSSATTSASPNAGDAHHPPEEPSRCRSPDGSSERARPARSPHPARSRHAAPTADQRPAVLATPRGLMRASSPAVGIPQLRHGENSVAGFGNETLDVRPGGRVHPDQSACHLQRRPLAGVGPGGDLVRRRAVVVNRVAVRVADDEAVAEHVRRSRHVQLDYAGRWQVVEERPNRP